MSDPKYPKPLPDDFGETTPNIKLPKSESSGHREPPSSNDWEKTNYNYSPKDLGQQDDWNKTSYNTPKAPKAPPSDYNNTYTPQQPRGKQDDWSMTEANIDIPFNQSNPHENPVEEEDFGPRQQHHGKTTPFIYLPESEKEKVKVQFQEHKPQTKSEEQKEEAEKKPLIPGWLWTTGGLFLMFMFAVVVMLGVYVFFLNPKGFTVSLVGVKPNTDILVDGSYWGVTSSDGSYRLGPLKAGTKIISFKNPQWNCKIGNRDGEVHGEDGDFLTAEKNPEVVMKCAPSTPPQPPGPSYEVLIVSAPPKSEVWVDDKKTETVTDDKGNAKVQVPEGPRNIEIKNPQMKCKIQQVIGAKGEKKEIVSNCHPAEIPDACFNLKKGEYDKAADCAFTELNRLEKLDQGGTPYTVDQVLFAMKLYIINFDSGKYIIKKPRDFVFIKRAAEFILKFPPSTIIEISGHTDNKGKDAANQKLSENRANSVKSELLKLGLKDSTFTTIGYGPRQPIEDNKTEDGRWRNRRIEYRKVS